MGSGVICERSLYTALCSAIDKENSIKFPLDFSILLIQLLHGLCTTFPTLII